MLCLGQGPVSLPLVLLLSTLLRCRRHPLHHQSGGIGEKGVRCVPQHVVQGPVWEGSNAAGAGGQRRPGGRGWDQRGREESR